MILNILISICAKVLFITVGIYFAELAILLLFPYIETCHDIPYSENIDMNFFLVIPCLNEEPCIQETVLNMLKIPMKNTRIIVIDDDSNDKTREKVLEIGNVYYINNDDVDLSNYNNEKLMLLHRHLPNARKGKGQSLNSAYALIQQIIEREGLAADRVIMSIFDADCFLSPHMLERVAVIMDQEPKTAMVQARVRMGTSTRDYFLPRLQDIEFFIVNNRIQNFREYMGTVAAAGNAQFNRFSAIDPECPWTTCLLEDFDFSTRLLLRGYRTRYLHSEKVYQQGVLDYKSFVKQRSRWCQGSMQCTHFYPDVLKSPYIPWYGKIEMAFFMILFILTLISLMTLTWSFLLLMLYEIIIKPDLFIINYLLPFSTTELVIIFMALMFSAFGPGLIFALFYYIDTKEKPLQCILTGLFLPLYNIMLAPAVVHAAWKQFIKKDGSWIKTDH